MSYHDPTRIDRDVTTILDRSMTRRTALFVILALLLVLWLSEHGMPVSLSGWKDIFRTASARSQRAGVPVSWMKRSNAMPG